MKKKYIIDVSKRLLELRRILGIQQKDMAQAIGITPSYLSDIENGNKTNPGFAFLHKISVHYQVSLDYLVHGIGDMFLPGSDREEQKIEDFQPVFNDIEDLVWLLKRSNYVKNTIMGFAVKFFIENEDTIKREMMRYFDQEKVVADELGSGSSKR
jgi:transcriptional regulator with XRE-family HTH domain